MGSRPGKPGVECWRALYEPDDWILIAARGLTRAAFFDERAGDLGRIGEGEVLSKERPIRKKFWIADPPGNC